jgi:heme O synthase-like polyprenyltransferase
MIFANLRLLYSANSKEAWRVYKLSAFPYLGLIFLAMCLDAWLLPGR